MSEINNTSILDKTSTAWPRVDDLVLIVKLYKHIDWDGTESPPDKDAMGRIMADPRLWPMYQLIRNHQEDPKYLAKLVRGYIPERAQQRQFATAWRLATEQVEIQLKARDAAKPAAEAAPEPAAAAALAWLDAGYWPVVISPITHPGPNPGKKPLGGNDWGA